jgi:hypothetical protein
MPYTYTLNDLRAGTIQNVAGVCVDSNEFTLYVNDAQRQLMRRGSWFDTEHLIKICIYNGCITWPRYVGTVLGMRHCMMHDIQIRNNWYRIIGPSNCGWSSNITARDAGTAPTYNEITGEDGKLIRVYIEKNNDVGKTLKIFGINGTTNLPLQEFVDGAWVDGITLTFAKPFAVTTVPVRRITSVLKQATEGNVHLYEYDTVSATMRDLALYAPSETNPRYRRTTLTNFTCLPSACSETDGVRYASLEALIKIAFIPVEADNDFLMIDNFDAIKLMVHSLRLEEAGKDAEAAIKRARAIEELNFEYRDRNPGPQTTVRVSPMGRHIMNPI